ncbi:MAG: hypothetical protein Q8O72_06210 [Bacteroidales bacterium]|jgi:hypothetical protein|nr:hypothetical protein [Bacteroidales bacterium]
MKKITLILFALAIISVVGCSKSSSTPDTIYTVQYSIVSTGTVIMDTIQYKNMNGETITLLGQNNADYSFTSNNQYDADLYMAGNLKDGTVVMSLTILNGSAVDFTDVHTETWSDPNTSMHFQYRSAKKISNSK